MLIDFIDGADIGMIDSRRGARFPLKPFHRYPVLGHVSRQELECNLTAESEVLGAVNHTHAAFAKFFDDAVMRYDPAKHLRSFHRRAPISLPRLKESF